MIDVNTQAAALQNAAGLQGLFNTPTNAAANQLALQNSYARSTMALQHQLEMRSQAASLAAAQQRQTEALSAEATRQGVQISAEASRQSTQISAEKEMEQHREAAYRDTQLAVQDKEQQGRRELNNQLQAESVRNNPLASRILNLNDKKYDPSTAAGNNQLVQDWAGVTASQKENIAATQAGTLNDALAKTRAQVAAYPSSQEGQALLVNRILADPSIQGVLTQSMATRYDASKFQAIQQLAQTDPNTALVKLYSDLNTASHGAVLGMRMEDAIQQVQQGVQTAKMSLINPQSAPIAVQQLYQTAQSLEQQRNQLVGSGLIFSPEGMKLSQGTNAVTPLTSALLANSGTNSSAPAFIKGKQEARGPIAGPDIPGITNNGYPDLDVGLKRPEFGVPQVDPNAAAMQKWTDQNLQKNIYGLPTPAFQPPFPADNTPNISNNPYATPQPAAPQGLISNPSATYQQPMPPGLSYGSNPMAPMGMPSYQPGVNPYQLMNSNALMSAAYGSQ